MAFVSTAGQGLGAAPFGPSMVVTPGLLNENFPGNPGRTLTTESFLISALRILLMTDVSKAIFDMNLLRFVKMFSEY